MIRFIGILSDWKKTRTDERDEPPPQMEARFKSVIFPSGLLTLSITEDGDGRDGEEWQGKER